MTKMLSQMDFVQIINLHPQKLQASQHHFLYDTKPSKNWCWLVYNFLGYRLGMGPSTCSLDARSVLGVFDGARARVLESEHMLVLARARG